MCFPGGIDSTNSTCNAGDLIELRRSLGERNGSPLQYSYLENLMDREDWQTTVHADAKSWT